MKELLAAFLSAIQGIKDQANAMLRGLPPLEQFEASAEISYGIRALQRYGNELVQNADNLTSKMSEFATRAEEALANGALGKAEASLLEKKDADGKPVYVKATDANAALTAALLAKEKEVRGAVTAEMETKTRIAERRTKLVTDKTIPAVAAAKLSDELLGAENCDASVAKVKDRIGRLGKLGLTEQNCEQLVSQAASLPLDEAGEAQFSASLSVCEAAVKASRGTGGGGGNLNPLLGAPRPDGGGNGSEVNDYI